MVFIYVLQLEKDKYYIGKTNNPEFRLESHYNSNGSEWTNFISSSNIVSTFEFFKNDSFRTIQNNCIVVVFLPSNWTSRDIAFRIRSVIRI